MVTLNGDECHNEWEITFEEIHRNNIIAHAIVQYTVMSGKIDFILDYGLEMDDRHLSLLESKGFLLTTETKICHFGSNGSQ